MTRASLDDEALLAAAKAASTTPLPTPSQTARRARALDQAIARHDERQRRAVPRRTVAAAALLVAGAASATTAWLTTTATASVEQTTSRASAAEAAPARGRRGAVHEPTAHVVDVAEPLVMPRGVPATSATSTTSTRAPDDARIRADVPTAKKKASSTSRLARGDGGAATPPPTPPPTQATPATFVATTGVGGVEDAVEARAVVVDVEDAVAAPMRGDVAARALDDDGVHEARELRDRCIDGLRTRRDRGALDDCRVFGQRFPGHPAARALAFGAGGLAEELGLPRDAIAAYSRAILLSPLVGSTWDDALLARARVYAHVGELDEARADLRIYLHRSPASAGNADVDRLRRALHVE